MNSIDDPVQRGKLKTAGTEMGQSTKAGPRATGKRKTGDPAGGGPALTAILPRASTRRTRRVMKTSELIARDIILDIAESGLKAGDSLLPEASMLKHYEVGRASLREALRLLEVQGLMHIRTGAKGGPVVGAASAEHLARMLTLYFGLAGATYEDLCDVIVIVYPRIAEVAARRKLTKANIQSLKSSLELTCGAPNPRLRAETFKDFHTLLSELSGNAVWSLITDAIGLVFADHIVANTDSRGFFTTSADDHTEIAEAVLRGNAVLAGERMLAHTHRMIAFYRGQNPRIFSQLIEWR
jgi:GntR family transcriptional repressor for pyruvate dehydrogenase complex